jgi:hypothetical protein
LAFAVVTSEGAVGQNKWVVIYSGHVKMEDSAYLVAKKMEARAVIWMKRMVENICDLRDV